MSASRLRVALLWHFHQPDYRIGNRAVLPWVRLHATKDYAELPAIHRDFPALRLTYNITPILLEQLQHYACGQLDDEHGILSTSDHRALSSDQKRRLLQWAFVGHAGRMIEPFPRYRRLHKEAAGGNIQQWSEHDWLDLQVWMRLAWLGPTTRRVPTVARLIEQGEHFTLDDRQRLVSLEHGLLVTVVERLRQLSRQGCAELTTSPYYHPILPLLCTSDAVAESDPELERLDPPFSWRSDAIAQVERALDAMNQHMGVKPCGMWPSEGALSDDALAVLASSGIEWTASDRAVLLRTDGALRPTQAYQPFIWRRDNCSIVVFFRDSELSDAIGFVYSQWRPSDAVADFLERLRRIRQSIIEQEGIEFLTRAVVPVVLDGENCWEYYEHNGEPFLRRLYEALSTSEEFETVTFGQLARAASVDSSVPVIEHLRAGSWIGGSLRIWSGHTEDRRAWMLLQRARACFERCRHTLEGDVCERAYRHLLTAEGSDWFWWFGDEHRAAFRSVFDVLFRYHLAEAYRAMGVAVPAELDEPIMSESSVQEGYGAMHPAIDPSEFQPGG